MCLLYFQLFLQFYVTINVLLVNYYYYEEIIKTLNNDSMGVSKVSLVRVLLRCEPFDFLVVTLSHGLFPLSCLLA